MCVFATCIQSIFMKQQFVAKINLWEKTLVLWRYQHQHANGEFLLAYPGHSFDLNSGLSIQRSNTFYLSKNIIHYSDLFRLHLYIFTLTNNNAVVKSRNPDSAVPPTQIFLPLLTDNFNRQSFTKANSVTAVCVNIMSMQA